MAAVAAGDKDKDDESNDEDSDNQDDDHGSDTARDDYLRRRVEEEIRGGAGANRGGE